MTVAELIAWHQRKAERAAIDNRNASKQARGRRSTPDTRANWLIDAGQAQDSVIFHRNAVKLLESINHEQTV